MSAKQALQQLVAVLSERECAELLRLVQPVAEGDRFWEDDAAMLYNQQARVRSLTAQPSQATAGGDPQPADAAGCIFAPIPVAKSYAGAVARQLPAPSALDAGFGDMVRRRRSRREFGDAPLTLGQLSTLLYHACGVTGFKAAYGYDRLPLRSFPSCGALQAPEVYLLIRAVGAVEPGVYHYRPSEHALERIGDADGGTLRAAGGANWAVLERAAVTWIITGCYDRLRWKYGPRAYRLMCMEIGGLAENLCLAAQALGLGACALGDFADTPAEDLIGLTSPDEFALLLVAVGVPAGDPAS